MGTVRTWHLSALLLKLQEKMPSKDQGFTEDQIEDFKEVFQLFDTKGDGLIQVSQVGDVLRALGTNPTEGEVKKLIQSSCSSKEDARVTFETFLPMLKDVSSKPIRTPWTTSLRASSTSTRRATD